MKELHFLNKLAPNNIVMIKSTRKMKNKTFAIEAAPSAIPPKPNMAAMIAMTKKIIDQRNIIFNLNEEYEEDLSSSSICWYGTNVYLTLINQIFIPMVNGSIEPITVECYLRNQHALVVFHFYQIGKKWFCKHL